MLKQQNPICCRCCCLQPNIDWVVWPYQEELQVDQELPVMMFIKEEAPYCGRSFSWCAPGFRSTVFTAYDGPNVEPPYGRPLLRHEKNTTCGINMVVGITQNGQVVRLPCCFCLPYLDTIDATTNTMLGSTHYLCCHRCSPVPQFSILDAQDKPKYLIRPDTCWCVYYITGTEPTCSTRTAFYLVY